MGWVTFHATGERLGDACRTCGGTGQTMDRYTPDDAYVVPCPDCGSGALFEKALRDADDAVRMTDLLFGPSRAALEVRARELETPNDDA